MMCNSSWYRKLLFKLSHLISRMMVLCWKKIFFFFYDSSALYWSLAFQSFRIHCSRSSMRVPPFPKPGSTQNALSCEFSHLFPGFQIVVYLLPCFWLSTWQFLCRPYALHSLSSGTFESEYECRLLVYHIISITHCFVSFSIRRPLSIVLRSSWGLDFRKRWFFAFWTGPGLAALTQARLNQSIMYSKLCFPMYMVIFVN